MRIALTGGSGKLGSVVLEQLRSAGHEVTDLDVAGPRREGSLRVDLTDYGDVVDALAAAAHPGVDRTDVGLDDDDALDAIVHLAAVPAPNLRSEAATFRNNMLSTFNVFQAARRMGVRRIVYASSETVLGLPFDVPPPYIPVDEEYAPRPESVYSLVKTLEEELARQLVRWDPELSITALRFSNVMHPEDYAAFPAFDADPGIRRWNLWGYIDARDGAQAIERALQTREAGFEAFIIANADTVMSRSSASLAAEVFPDVEVRRELGEHETMLGIDKARRMLGYDPQHSWRDAVAANTAG